MLWYNQPETTTTEDDVIHYCYDQDVEIKEHKTMSKKGVFSNFWYLTDENPEGPFKTLSAACWHCCEKMGWVLKAAGWAQRRNKPYGND